MEKEMSAYDCEEAIDSEETYAEPVDEAAGTRNFDEEEEEEEEEQEDPSQDEEDEHEEGPREKENWTSRSQSFDPSSSQCASGPLIHSSSISSSSSSTLSSGVEVERTSSQEVSSSGVQKSHSLTSTEGGHSTVVVSPGLSRGERPLFAPSTSDPSSFSLLEQVGEEVFFLGQEDDEGNVEYKWRLINPTPERFQKLVTQMKFRLAEGNGECWYELGVSDDGFLRGLSPEDFDASVGTLRRMAEELKAELTILAERDGEEGRVAEVLVRSYNEENYLDLRITVCGNVDAGKSTLIGVLTGGELDNGRGAARSKVFRHKHEIETGRTSSVGCEILGFDASGQPVNNSIVHHGWADIVQASSKIVSFVDLAGHEKYLKTTVFGMSATQPDYAMLLVGANMGVTRMTKEHLGLCLALKLPFFVVVTKVDICPPNILEETLGNVAKLLRLPGVRKVQLNVRSTEDVITAAKNISNGSVTPVFQISNVTGIGLDELRTFLNIVPQRQCWDDLSRQPTEFIIEDSFQITGVGVVVSGTIVSGSVAVGDSLMLGPDGNGAFKSVQIRGIHTRRLPVRRAYAGQSASFSLKKVKRNQIRKGMVMLEETLNPVATWTFDAEIVILFHSSTIRKNYQPVVHIGSVRQAACIVNMEDELMRTGDRAVVRFRFMFRPEYIKAGTRLIFREGRTKGIGVVSQVSYDG